VAGEKQIQVLRKRVSELKEESDQKTLEIVKLRSCLNLARKENEALTSRFEALYTNYKILEEQNEKLSINLESIGF